jgi:hypothetical protein
MPILTWQFAKIPYAIARRKDKKKHIHLEEDHFARRIEENHHFSLDMNIDTIHIRDIRILDQTFWWLQSFAVEFKMNDSLSIELETPSCCVDHLDKSRTLRIDC